MTNDGPARNAARILSIEDVRGYGAAVYSFTYDQSGGLLIPPHLTSITNSIGTAEKYTFTYGTEPLWSPFNSANQYGSWKFLQIVTNGIGLSNQFAYDTTTNSGELLRVTMPYGGYLRWVYGNATYNGSRTQREVIQRFLPKSGGESQYTMYRDGGDSSRFVHDYADFWDTDGNAEKVWYFQTDTTQFNRGLMTSYQERDLPAQTTRLTQTYTWTQQLTSLNPYISNLATQLDTGPVKQVTQQIDQYGNVTQVQIYDWGASNPTRTYTNAYLTGGISGFPTYASLYILNRLVSSTVTDGTKSTTLVQNTYDSASMTDSPGIHEHDSNMGTSWQPRGNVAQSSTPDATTALSRDIGGNITSITKNGVTTAMTTNSTTTWAAPSAITLGTFSSSISYNSFLGITSDSGPNGDTTSIAYDSTNGRPTSTTSPFGATTTITYNDTASPPTRVSTTNGHWTRANLDGFGRTFQTDTGDTQSRSTVQVQYAACGCSPLGKMSKTSEPYAPNGTVYWTSYLYDSMGRTHTVTAPDGSVTTYTYSGNTVTATDAANHSKTFTMDAFGNLTQVNETDPTLGAVSTYYTYDILNHLIQVRMPRGASNPNCGNTNVQCRTFDYSNNTNTVGAFLTSATNPENGTVSYTYSSAGPEFRWTVHWEHLREKMF